MTHSAFKGTLGLRTMASVKEAVTVMRQSHELTPQQEEEAWQRALDIEAGNIAPAGNRCFYQEDQSRSQSGDVRISSNLTGYSQPGSDNWEHDGTGCKSNLSGVTDDFDNAMAEQNGWQPGYDY